MSRKYARHITINEAIQAAIADWRSTSPNVPDEVLADQIRTLVDEAIVEYLPEADQDDDPDLLDPRDSWRPE